MSFAPKLCVYCGKPGSSKEHIRGSWSRAHALAKLSGTEHQLVRYPDGDHQQEPSISKGGLTRDGGPRSSTLKIACVNCNNGWMNRIIGEAKPTITDLNYGYWGQISLDRQSTVAAWIAMFVMSHEFADKETVCVSQHERTFLMDNGLPSENWQIAIGFGAPNPPNDMTTHRALELRPEYEWDGNRRFQITTSYFGRLLFMAYYADFDNLQPEPFFIQNGLASIWPARTTPLRKPFRTHDEDSVGNLTALFTEWVLARM